MSVTVAAHLLGKIVIAHLVMAQDLRRGDPGPGGHRYSEYETAQAEPQVQVDPDGLGDVFLVGEKAPATDEHAEDDEQRADEGAQIQQFRGEAGFVFAGELFWR